MTKQKQGRFLQHAFMVVVFSSGWVFCLGSFLFFKSYECTTIQRHIQGKFLRRIRIRKRTTEERERPWYQTSRGTSYGLFMYIETAAAADVRHAALGGDMPIPWSEQMNENHHLTLTRPFNSSCSMSLIMMWCLVCLSNCFHRQHTYTRSHSPHHHGIVTRGMRRDENYQSQVIDPLCQAGWLYGVQCTCNVGGPRVAPLPIPRVFLV